MGLEHGETLLISVTPVADGIVAPLSLLLLLEAVVVAVSMKWSFLHRYEGFAMALVGVLPGFVIATRSWRWRSHKITLTTQRVIIEGGVLARRSTQVNLGDVSATHADQTFSERLRRRGVVLLDMPSGTVMLGPLRHPAALGRLVDRARRDLVTRASPAGEGCFDDPDTQV